jgi:hypothetical protein
LIATRDKSSPCKMLNGLWYCYSDIQDGATILPVYDLDHLLRTPSTAALEAPDYLLAEAKKVDSS